MTLSSAECPIEIRSPRLIEVDIQRTGRRAVVATLKVQSPETIYTLVISNPCVVEKQMNAASESDVRECFDGDCGMVQVCTGRSSIEFWSDQGFLGRTIKGSSLEVAKPRLQLTGDARDG
jgi:hypothetical protein